MYQCGGLTVAFSPLSSLDGRTMYQAKTWSDQKTYLETTGFEAPSWWKEDKIARELVGWTLDLMGDAHEELFFLVEYQDEEKDNEDTYLLSRIC